MRFTPLCVLLLLSSCSLFGDDEKAQDVTLPVEIEYHVTGTERVFITYQDSLAERIGETIIPPWSYRFRADSVRALYIHSLPTGENIQLTIRIDGETYRQASSEDGEAFVLAWAKQPARVGYLASGSNPGSFTINTSEGEEVIMISDIIDDGLYSFRETYKASPGMDVYIKSNIDPGLNCPSFSVVYVDPDNLFYNMDTNQTCDNGTVVQAVIPGF